MTSNFDRWEKDPFFLAAEQVQESADRMESTHRTWIHAMKDSSSIWNPEELRRDLHTTLGTTKWQLDEFERAAKSSYTNSSVDAKDRHREFIVALESQISKVENSLQESAVSAGKPPRPWVRLDERESDELALFLSGDKVRGNVQVKDQQTGKPQDADKQSAPNFSKSSSQSVESRPGHRRTASAGADISAWNIAVSDDVFPHSSSNVKLEPPPRKIPSFSGFLNTMDSAFMLKWSKNDYRKLKLPDSHQEAESTFLESHPLTRGINACYERSKSYLDSSDDCYDKQLYGWYGAIQRQLQRSQYHMQYSRPIQIIFWIVLLLCFIVLLSMRAI